MLAFIGYDPQIIFVGVLERIASLNLARQSYYRKILIYPIYRLWQLVPLLPSHEFNARASAALRSSLVSLCTELNS